MDININFFFKIHVFSIEPLNITNETLITIPKGSTMLYLQRLMEKKNIIRSNSHLLSILVKINPNLKNIKAGTYALHPGMNIKDALNIFVIGKEKQFSIQFIEGSTLKDCLNILKNSPELQQDIDMNNLNNLSKQLGDKSEILLEGSLYPDKYLHTKNTKVSEILKRAKQNMTNILKEIWETRDKNLPYESPQSLLVMASIIEKESALKYERFRISSVFVNRLKNKMKLQSDPTVEYGVKLLQPNKKITYKDFKISTPYNTYIIYGLPKTAISMPSLESIQAAAHPEKSDYFYFVSTGNGDHIFSQDFDSHKQAVKNYRRWKKGNK
ncbi:MAG: endolytic transglycosylase MltG [Wigglesworthia glossinidia]|nr:endolytic transglycosylase MltG [Wigglesworthia glossinidia]